MDASSEKKEDKIESAESALYSRSADGIFLKKRHSVPEDTKAGSYASTWNISEEKPQTSMNTIPYTKILLGALVFFVFAIGFAFFKFFGGSNVISGDNITITASGPVSVAGGETLPLDLDIKNGNSSALQNVSLLVEYPDGTVDPTNLSAPLKRYSELLGTINAGADITRLVKAAIFGQQNAQETIKISLEYNIAGSSATFNKEKDYTFLISSAPVNISVAGPTEVNANQQADFTVTVTSNSLSTLPGVVLQAAYPFGFNFVSSNPQPTTGSHGTTFALGNLAPGATQTVHLSGVVQGQDGEERVVNFTVGTLTTTNGASSITPFNVYSQDLSIKKSSVSVATQINGDTTDTVSIAAGNKVNVNLNWQNNLSDKIDSMSIKVALTGSSIDKFSVNTPDGFYNSANNSIVFDKSTIASLGTVNPADQDNLNFNFSTLLPASNPTLSFANAQIGMNITVTGNTVNGNGEVLYSGSKVLKVSSDLSLLARGFRTVGPFANSGPLPPKVDTQSTYTITWTATNSFNSVNNAIVSAVLPANVSWLGVSSPSNANISYNQGTGAVTWNVGNMRAGTGTKYPPNEVSFQIAVTPSVTQVGQDITLLNQSTITGTDSYSGAMISENGPEVTTNIASDPQYVDGIGKVIQ